MIYTIFRKALGLLAVAIGSGILAWIIYNLLVETLPEFEEHKWGSPVGILVSIAMISVGFDWLFGKKVVQASEDCDLCRLFMETAQKILANYPKLGYTLDVDEAGRSCTLTIPKRDSDGFDISVEATAREITVRAEGWHTHVDFFEDAENVVLYSMGLVRDLLSPHMRLRLLCSGGRPYRYRAEVLADGRWKRHSATGSALWNYAGKRSERILQNRVLYGRSDTPAA